MTGNVSAARSLVAQAVVEPAVANHDIAHLVLHTTPDGFALYDLNLRVVYVNPQFCALWKVSEAQVLGRTEREVFQLKREMLEDAERDASLLFIPSDGKPLSESQELSYIRLRNGNWYERLVTNHNVDGALAGYLVQWRNVTGRQNDLHLIQYERDLMQSMMDSIPDQIFFKDRNSCFIRINKALALRYGLEDPSEAIGKSDADYYSAEHAAETRREELHIMTTLQPLLKQVHHEVWGNGEDAWNISTKMPLLDARGAVIGTYGVAHDITAQKRSEALIWEQANFDSLTQLPNRRLLRDRWEQAVYVHRRNQQSFAVVLIDLDQFKSVNDTLGHAIGDQLLIEASRRMLGCLRASDTLARWGGDEFALMVTGLSADGALDVVARNLVECLSQPFFLDGHTVQVSGSLGISLFPDDAESFEELMQRSDRAMYEAKRRGKNCYWRFSPDLKASPIALARGDVSGPQ